MTIRPLWVLLLVASWSLTVSGVRADAPFDDQQREHAAEARKAGHDARGAIDLLTMQRNAGDADPALTRELYEALAKDPRLDPQVHAYARHRLAWDLRRLGQMEASMAAFDELGYVRDFRLLGPFDNEGKQGLDTAAPPEEAIDATRDLAATYPGRERIVSWRTIPDAVRGGYVSFDALFSPTENVCGFAETSLRAERDQPITLWVGTGGAFKLYFNGQEVLRDEAYRGAFPNRHVAAVRAQKGLNRVLVKVCTAAGPWGFYLRTADSHGNPLPMASEPDALEATPAAAGKPPRAPTTWLESLSNRAEKKGASAQALADYAAFLQLSSGDDPAQEWAKTYALRAVEKQPNVERLLLAAGLVHERHERMRLVAQAAKLAPNDRKVQLQRAELIRDGHEPERALSLFEAVGEEGATGLRAVGARAAMLIDLGMAQSALQLLGAQAQRTRGSRRWQWARAEALRAQDRQDEANVITREVFAQHADMVPARRVLFRSDLRHGDVTAALAHADALRQLFPAHAGRLREVASMYEAAQRDDLKFAVLTDLVELNPQSASGHVAYGRALLRSDREEAAADSFRTALSLSPQDAETRELLEQLHPQQRLDESYAVDGEALLARRMPKNGHPVTVLSDLTVNTVFDNGLGSRFVQFSAQAHDEEGARQLRTRSIQFDPETQRVDLRAARVYRKDGRVLDATQTYVHQLGEPWYRIYYDTRAMVVIFPDLEPGDSVELRYRIDDVAHRNQFADYYGDLHYFQGSEPRKHVEYVLIAPKSRELFFNEPKLEGLRHETKDTDTQRIHRYWADDVPALSPEPGMPGATEILPYLHVSTYGKWNEVARWYWGLIKDQLRPDDSLKATVAELKKGAKDPQQLVERIYGWVIANTRYVGLEFGIHGFLPYRVSDIVRRGFGDCKDKASLIYTMLEEAGIDARIVLLRTRRNGDIDPLPASLAVFDHAIAYVPELDLYLDGTAEHHGAHELPFGDQGVQVLVVGPKDSALKKTPVLPAERNVRERHLAVELAADGSARVKVDETVRGGEAPGLRARYQAPGTRAERLERSLAARYPGLDVKHYAFEGLTETEGDIGVHYTIHAPQLAQRDGESLRLSPSVLEDLARALTRSPRRDYPLEIGERNLYIEERRIALPKGFIPARLPTGGERQSRFGTLTLRVEQQAEVLVVQTRLEMNVERVAAADYPAFRKWIQNADKLLQQRITLSPRQP